MLLVSVVIIAKNEEKNIASCIRTAKQVATEVIVADSGSTDATVEIARMEGAKVVSIAWSGYGNARNTAAEIAENEWILAVDADEKVTAALVSEINKIENPNSKTVYGFIRQNYYYRKRIRFAGNFGRDKVYRLYNKREVSWDKAPVHEVLIGDNLEKKLIKGYLEHYTVNEWSESEIKIINYAKLNARKYFERGKKATFIKRFLSPTVGFLVPYFLRLGFLDGKAGFLVCYSNAKCTWLKYKYLHEMGK